ncbi:hypothetical protein GUITHDRAFT_113770 [Guillardia theta CCMP2712]|uniref:Uncharacterized protein n=1 Tax=Guillardia theta (strain CCMP2712) TaxID=905079 RepID=L1IVW6_GUITC|nr:hypothetical protein GUITHDRAFT_113770 [Guillardia theta CCMP2712]EKX40034.1 hypothetical protein GUITHDRAFT_113770 [Guillardia theta CCMP2712]|eukprot:XP_005827014.1 hypothetical protein GUITHDRAFT_113770 [Guillardia theta CCMP2712]
MFAAVRRLQSKMAGDRIVWDPNGNGYYVYSSKPFWEEWQMYDPNAGGGLGAWDRDHHYDIWGKPETVVKTPIHCNHPGCPQDSF